MNYKKVYPETSLKTADVLAADGAFNIGCFVLGGKLVPAITSYTTAGSPYEKSSAAWYSAALKKYIIFTQNRMYFTSGNISAASSSTFMAKDPSMVEENLSGGPTVYFIGDTSYFFLGTPIKLKTFNGAVHSCVLKNGRIFGIDNSDPNKIKWSGEGGIDDWAEDISGAGWTIVQHGYGEILNLIVYKDKIVVVREYGLTLFSAYGTPENYKLSHLERKLPKIYKNTVAVVGEKLAFYTEDGLYFYDGNKVEKCTLSLAEEMESPTFASCAKGTYYLCGVSKTLNRKAVFVYNANNNTTYIINAPVNAVTAGEIVHGYSDTYDYKFAEGGTYTFTSGEINFSSNSTKVLKEVIVYGARNVTLEVSNGVNSRIVRGVYGKFRPNMRGKSFTVTVYGKEKIDGISAVAEVMDGV